MGAGVRGIPTLCQGSVDVGAPLEKSLQGLWFSNFHMHNNHNGAYLKKKKSGT